MSTPRIIIGGLIILLGLSALTGLDVFQFFFPLLLIWIGWRILFGKRMFSSEGDFQKSSLSADTIDEVLVFSGAKRTVKSDAFSGGRIIAVFGGADFDLSEAKASGKQISMELVAVFGGIQLRIPKNWHVTSEATSIMGGIDNKTQPEEKNGVELHIRGAAVLGGVEIRD